MLIGGGFGLFLWTREGEPPLLVTPPFADTMTEFVVLLLLVPLPLSKVAPDDGEEEDEVPNIELDVFTGDEMP